MQKPYNTNIQESATNSFCIDQSGVAEIGREELRAKEFESLRKNQSRIYPKSKSYTSISFLILGTKCNID
jgi:hypothetical protein